MLLTTKRSLAGSSRRQSVQQQRLVWVTHPPPPPPLSVRMGTHRRTNTIIKFPSIIRAPNSFCQMLRICRRHQRSSAHPLRSIIFYNLLLMLLAIWTAFPFHFTRGGGGGGGGVCPPASPPAPLSHPIQWSKYICDI